MTDHDVIVVGARLAGASTAMLLARRGHDVLLVDRAELPSDTVSTHAMTRSGILQLARWGVLDEIVAAGTPPVRSLTLGFGDERVVAPLKVEYGVDALYAPRRTILDAVLLEAAVDGGVESRLGVRAVDVIETQEGRIGGVVLQRGTETTEVTARLVIGADGTHSRIADLVGARTLASHPPLNAVHYAYFSGVEHDGFWFQFTPGVNAGLVPTNDREVLAFVARPSSRWGEFREDPDTRFTELLTAAGRDLAGCVAGGVRVSPYRGTPGLYGFMRRCWGPGWALVGDAGYTKDPISAHGMSDALRDAELCARAADVALRDRQAAAEAFDGYQRIRDELSLSIFEESRALAGFAWDAGEASARMRVISEAVRSECDALSSLPAWGVPISSAA
jgi:flavin-dependent dehydrogenase